MLRLLSVYSSVYSWNTITETFCHYTSLMLVFTQKTRMSVLHVTILNNLVAGIPNSNVFAYISEFHK